MESREPRAMEDIVMNALVGPADGFNKNNHQRLLCTVWRKMKSRHPYNDEGTLQATIDLCLEEYTTMKESMTSFLQDDSVKAYLAAPPSNIPEWRVTRPRAVKAFWCPPSTTIRPGVIPPVSLSQVRPYDLLLNRRFDLMLELAKYYVHCGAVDIHAHETY